MACDLPEPAVGVFTAAVGFGKARAGQWRGRCPGAGPAAVMRIRDVAPGVGHDQRHVTCVQPCREAGRSAGPDTVPHDSHGRAGWGRELQISRLFCKPICKPDAAKQRETEPTGRDVICPIRRGHWTPRDSPRRRDTRRMAHNPEVAGSNPGPATKARGPFSNRERAFCMWFANGFANEVTAMAAMDADPITLPSTTTRVDVPVTLSPRSTA